MTLQKSPSKQTTAQHGNITLSTLSGDVTQEHVVCNHSSLENNVQDMAVFRQCKSDFKNIKLQEERHSRLYLLVRKAHCCVKQGSILLIAQSASSVAVISIFTVKEQVVDNTMCSITIQWHKFCFANKHSPLTSHSCCCFGPACDASYVRLTRKFCPIIRYAGLARS